MGRKTTYTYRDAQFLNRYFDRIINGDVEVRKELRKAIKDRQSQLKYMDKAHTTSGTDIDEAVRVAAQLIQEEFNQKERTALNRARSAFNRKSNVQSIDVRLMTGNMIDDIHADINARLKALGNPELPENVAKNQILNGVVFYFHTKLYDMDDESLIEFVKRTENLRVERI